MIEHVDIHAVDHCNFSCKDCGHFSPHYLPIFHSADEYIESLRKLEEWDGLEEVCVIGGEPTLHPKLLDFIAKIRSSGSWKVRLVTNGWWISDHFEWLQLLRDAVDVLWVSIHPELQLDKDPLEIFGKLVDNIVQPMVTKKWHKMEFSDTAELPRVCDWYNCFALQYGKLYRCAASAYSTPELVTKQFWKEISGYDVITGDIVSFKKWKRSKSECCKYCRVPNSEESQL